MIIFRRVFIILILLGTVTISAQDPSVEKSIFGIQVGLLGAWVHNEARLSSQFALRSEIGYDLGFSSGDSSSNIAVSGMLRINIESRWYYNLEERLSKGRRIDGNSGNLVSINVGIAPDWLASSNDGYRDSRSSIYIVPYWGIRRSIGKHIIFETGIGIGYYWDLNQPKSPSIFDTQNEGLAVLPRLSFGYQF